MGESPVLAFIGRIDCGFITDEMEGSAESQLTVIPITSLFKRDNVWTEVLDFAQLLCDRTYYPIATKLIEQLSQINDISNHERFEARTKFKSLMKSYNLKRDENED